MSKVRIIDPDNVPEVIVAGPFNCSIRNGLATLTFTHERAVPEKLMAQMPEVAFEAVVRVRMVMPVEGLRSLRDSLDQMIRNHEAQHLSPTTAGSH
jgi:hypothetical protein